VTHVTHPVAGKREAATVLRRGEWLENPVTGERVLIRTTAAESGGERFEIECFLLPDAPRQPEHLHPRQESAITVVKGVCGVKRAGEVRFATPGQRIIVPARAPHQVWNAGGDTLHLHVEQRPALQSSERLLVAVFSLAAAGKTDSRGVPSLLQQVVMIPAYADAVRFAGTPWPVQRAVCALLGPVARVRGHRPSPAEPPSVEMRAQAAG
jgi:quercetin dioxygenase-like cupin family protein